MQPAGFPLVLLICFGESSSCFHGQQKLTEVERASVVIQMDNVIFKVHLLAFICCCKRSLTLLNTSR